MQQFDQDFTAAVNDVTTNIQKAITLLKGAPSTQVPDSAEAQALASLQAADVALKGALPATGP